MRPLSCGVTCGHSYHVLKIFMANGKSHLYMCRWAFAVIFSERYRYTTHINKYEHKAIFGVCQIHH